MGLKDLQLTLYDILGYFPPGIVLLLAVAAGILAVVPETCIVDLTVLHSWKVLLALLFAAYVLGHVAQTIADLFRYRTERYLFDADWNADGLPWYWRLRRLWLRFGDVRPLSDQVSIALLRTLRDFYTNPVS